MNWFSRHKKKLLPAAAILLLAVYAGYRYIPFSKLMRVSRVSEQSYAKPVEGNYSAPRSILFDFEVAKGQDVPGGLEKGNAHSGEYAAKAFGKNSFTPAIERTVEQVGSENLSGVGASCWLYVKPNSGEVNAALVFSASNALGVNVCWKGISVRDPGVPRGKWFKISGFFDLKDIAFKPGTKIQVYFWNNSETDILADDYYIVFGGAVPRRGDTSFVDLTKAPFTPRFNYPPFPVGFLTRQSLTPGKETSPDPTAFLGSNPDALILSGDFLGKKSGDQVLVLGTDRKMKLFGWCQTLEKYNAIDLQSDLLPEMPLKMLGGNFLKGRPDQVLFCGKASSMLVSIEGLAGGLCDEKAKGPPALKTLWKGPLPLPGAVSVTASDFNGDGVSELLCIGEKGEWGLYSLNSRNEWTRDAGCGLQEAGCGSPAEWNQGNFVFTVNSGKFTNAPGIQALTVFRDRKSGICGYSLRRFDAAKKTFKAVLPVSGLSGKLIGIDTLKPEDRFFTLSREGKTVVLRYNRDWRFDLKEIVFSDSTYQIIRNIDFKGYSGDHNPKYYGNLILIPFAAGQGAPRGFLVVGRNAAARENGAREFMVIPGLPDFMDVYNFNGSK
jgi:hypothetical protein